MAVGRIFMAGIAVGAVVGVVLPMLFPGVRKNAAPVARMALKGGAMLYDEVRDRVSEMAEMAEDVVAEVRHERAHGETSARPGPGNGTGAPPSGDEDGSAHAG